MNPRARHLRATPSPAGSQPPGLGGFCNPKGIVASSPGLRGTSYPGLAFVRFSTPTGLRPLFAAGPQPRWGWPIPPAFPRVARSPRLRSALRRGKSQPWALGRNPFGIQPGAAWRLPVAWQDCAWQARVIVRPEPSRAPRSARPHLGTPGLRIAHPISLVTHPATRITF